MTFHQWVWWGGGGIPRPEVLRRPPPPTPKSSIKCVDPQMLLHQSGFHGADRHFDTIENAYYDADRLSITISMWCQVDIFHVNIYMLIKPLTDLHAMFLWLEDEQA